MSSATKPAARNLVEEAVGMAKKLKTSGAAPKWTGKGKGGAEDLLKALSTATGENLSQFVQALVVSVSDAACQAAIKSEDLTFQTCLSVMPGIYWKIGEFGGFPVFRQDLYHHHKHHHQTQKTQR